MSRFAGALGLSLALVEGGSADGGVADAISGAGAPGALPEKPASVDDPHQGGLSSAGTSATGWTERQHDDTAQAVVTDMRGEQEPGRVLTGRQREVLQVIRDSVERHGYPPSMREIGNAVGLASASSVAYHLSALESLGYLRRDAGRPRTVEVQRPEQPAARPGGETGEAAVGGIRPSETAHVPVMRDVPASGLSLADRGIEDVFSLPRPVVGEGSLFVLRVSDDCMDSFGIGRGDWVVVRRQHDVHEGDVVAAVAYGKATVRVFRRSGPRVALMPSNPTHPEIPGSEASILGPVVAHLRRFQ